jgi:hypothetical protein
MEQIHKRWPATVATLPRMLWTGALAPVKKGYNRLKKRYGPRYTKAMLLIVFLALFSPVPGTTLVAVVAVIGVAEVHRAVSRRRLCRGNPMSISVDVRLAWGATPEQLRAVGTALWRWGNRAGDAGIYQQLDNQALADLIAGKLPALARPSEQADDRCMHIRLGDEISQTCQAALASLRHALPAKGIEDVLIDGLSWNQTDSTPWNKATAAHCAGPIWPLALAAPAVRDIERQGGG